MFIKIPFENVIEFKTNIAEITKMSLEHDYSVNDKVVLGNFYISGDYRVHAISINKEPFKYTLPFTVELNDNINTDTLEFNIEDFSYDVIDNSKLKVNIVYSLKGELIMEDRIEEEISEEVLDLDKFLKEEDNCEEVSVEETLEDNKKVEEEKEEVLERDNVVEEKTIMDTIKDSDDTFVTYHVHIVSDSDNIDNICNLYNVTKDVISEYNDIDNINKGDKIIIPVIDE